MTITKSSESYLIQDNINDKEVTGRAVANISGDINITLSIQDGTAISYLESPNGKCSLNVSYDKANDPIDYLQVTIANVVSQITNNN